MQSILILALTLMGWLGNPNMGGPERLALPDDTHIHHQSSLSGSQNSGGPALDLRGRHNTQPNLGGSNNHKKMKPNEGAVS
ncbi:MAG TPA: hypothetical protein VF369_06395 [candidate division Zixibacteria bacterium]